MSTHAATPVLLALSGGVDSAVCAQLLRQQSYTVQGLYIVFSPAHRAGQAAAQQAAEELGIPLHIAYAEELFTQQVITPFCQAYASGLTPNPCVVCNPLVKFSTLASAASRLGIEKIASGHYACVTQRAGLFRVCQAKSLRRDQSYMLYRLPQAILSRLLLPAGELEKPEIRALARQLGLTSAAAPDSQEICFIPDGGYPAYINAMGFQGKAGHFIGPDGEDLGPHRGVHHYTVGQRKGLGIALGRPAFVQAICPSGNIQLAWPQHTAVAAITLQDVFLPTGDALFFNSPPSPAPSESFSALNSLSCPPPAEPLSAPSLALSAPIAPLPIAPSPPFTCQVKIRSMAALIPCTVSRLEASGLRVHFAQPQRAPAPGQHAVLYQNGCVIGGGVIQPTNGGPL